MRKLINGILEFRRDRLPAYREVFARLALDQSPDCLFVACADSRVVPNLMASTEPGELFMLRNVGNFIPPGNVEGVAAVDRSSSAALEFALLALNVEDLIVCGHSECGAMKAILKERSGLPAPNLDAWLSHGRSALDALQTDGALDASLPLHDQVSQYNVLEQLDHALSYPLVKARVDSGQLRLHGWWFEIASGTVYLYDEQVRRFMPIHEYAPEVAAELCVRERSYRHAGR